MSSDKFRHEFKRLRKNKGLTQEEIAKLLNVSRNTIANYEQGTRKPKYDKLEEIADFFNVPMSTFLEGYNFESISKAFSKAQSEAIARADQLFADAVMQYYVDDEANELAEFLRTNPDYKVLFDASRNVKPEDIEKVTEMIKLMTK